MKAPFCLPLCVSLAPLLALSVPGPAWAQETEAVRTESADSARSAQNAETAPLFIPRFLWSGSWESRHNLTDRFDLTLTAPGPALGLRFQILDRRPASSAGAFTGSFGGDTADKALTQPGLGLYHWNTGSRLLYGTLDTQGLSTRIRNVWIRGAPHTEARLASQGDLKTAPSSTAVPQAYLWLGSPELELGPGSPGSPDSRTLRGFVSVGIEFPENAPGASGGVSSGGGVPGGDAPSRPLGINAGAEYRAGKAALSLEGLYVQRTLPPRTADTWFSEKPPLPRRNTRLFAGSAAFSVPAFGITADLAASKTFAFGEDVYGNLGLRLGDRPWRLSLAVDGAGSRYVDSSGGVPGAGLRAAARLERRSKRQGLYRLGVLARGPGPGAGLGPALGAGDFAAIAEGFNRTSLEFYGRLPAPPASSAPPLALTRFSFSWDRDGRDTEKRLDTFGAMAAFKLGPLGSESRASLSRSGGVYGSHRITQSLSWTIRPSVSGPAAGSPPNGGPAKPGHGAAARKQSFTLGLSARAGYTGTAGKAGVWDTALSASVRGRQSGLTVKAASPKFPRTWEYTISWRMRR
ncbi:MAG: hypothetical protein LBD09_05380 [Treponema sp.]|jgi:hypothetical protein|nr:hypothetical protein [Treponema sp.]